MTKDLGLDWRIGAEFYESLLLDYDPVRERARRHSADAAGLELRELVR